MGRLSSLGSFFNCRGSPYFFSYGKSCILIWTKKCWATFRASFSQTHLVTLLETFLSLFPQQFSSHWLQGMTKDFEDKEIVMKMNDDPSD
jgi:hypothetical protein